MLIVIWATAVMLVRHALEEGALSQRNENTMGWGPRVSESVCNLARDAPEVAVCKAFCAHGSLIFLAYLHHIGKLWHKQHVSPSAKVVGHPIAIIQTAAWRTPVKVRKHTRLFLLLLPTSDK